MLGTGFQCFHNFHATADGACPDAAQVGRGPRAGKPARLRVHGSSYFGWTKSVWEVLVESQVAFVQISGLGRGSQLEPSLA